MQAVLGLETKYNIGLCNLTGFGGVICVESLVSCNAVVRKKPHKTMVFFRKKPMVLGGFFQETPSPQ